MKRNKRFALASVFVLISLLAVVVIPVAAAGENSISLIRIFLVNGKGVVFKFRVEGEFKEYTGFARVGGNEYQLSCHLNEDGDLVCMADHGLGQYVGEFASGELNGFSFGTTIVDPYFCYDVWDYDNSYVWHVYDRVCGDSAASSGDYVHYYNPDWGGTYTAMYLEEGLTCFNRGRAFYFLSCPGNN
jgi:hypothetical protein